MDGTATLESQSGHVPGTAGSEPVIGRLSEGWARPWSCQLAGPLALIVAGCCALAIDVRLSRALVLDDALIALDKVFESFEPFGHAVAVLVIVVGLWVCDTRLRWALPRVLLASLGAGLSADVLKLCIGRVRPYDYALDGHVWDTFRGLLPGLLSPGGGHSFPSAHVATAVGFCLALSTLYPRGRAWFALTAAMVAGQRVETGAHFLSDACWGAAVGWLFAIVLFRQDCAGCWFDHWEAIWSRQASHGINSPNALPQPEVALEVASHERSTPALPTAAANASVRWAPADPIQRLSVVVPVYNEVENVPRVYRALVPVLSELPVAWEIVFVDDGSSDGSDRELARLAQRDARVKVVTFRRNFGQTAAMSAGMRFATGDAIVLLDGDLQNDPTDIPMMLRKLDEGYDLVHGWRKDRHDRFLDRRLPSMIANWLISKSTGFPVHDLGCTLKALRSDVARELKLYGEMHRFIPILAHCRGARCTEVVTKHHARQFGTSKYGISRTFRVLLDLITVKFLTQYLTSPMKLFGKWGLYCGAVGALCGAATLGMKLAQQVDMTGNPLLLATVFSCMAGLQLLCLGVLGELAMRTYFEAQDRTSYVVRRTLNLTATAADDRPIQAA